MKSYLLTILITLFAFCSVAQKGKDGAYTVSTANNILNSYTDLTTDATAGANSLQVTNNALNTGAVFTTNLAPGDLIFIIQVQGASLNGTANPFIGFLYGTPVDSSWGAITAYNNCGNYEFAEVAGVSGSNTINLRCGLENNYTASGRVQVVRVPRFTDLTVDAGASVIPALWDGTTGGLVVLEVDNTLTVNGEINATGDGFRGGVIELNTLNFGGQYAVSNPDEGAEKGEGIAGYQTDYNNWGGQYCRAAGANAGGGGNAHNSGGGGGANASVGTFWSGRGVPDPAYAAAWNLEFPTFASTPSTGGGKGGYAISKSNQDALTTPPGDPAWNGGGDNRRNVGGLGGRPLDYSTGKLFFGGGGGAGEGNDGDQGAGGRAGGLIYIMNYGDVTGTGSIIANGDPGNNAEGDPSPGWGDVSGKDGAGGGGAGGTIVVNSQGNISGINITANGGQGGDQNLVLGAFASWEAQGPGGGGGGGYVSTTASTATIQTTGGANGTTNSNHLTEFPPNGATSGSDGLQESLNTFYVEVENDTICGGGSATLTANVVGALPGGTDIVWYDSDVNGTLINTGATYTTPLLTSNTTYYVGTCPGHYLEPVEVIVSPAINIDDNNISISDENCGNADGFINGIVASGGSGSLSFDWNGTTTASEDLNNVSAGNYTLTVTDANGCSETSGPYTINNSSSITIDDSNISISDENCGNADGSITGIVASGGTGGLSFDWNGNTTVSEDLNNVGAGSYTLTVTDGVGCTATAGPYTINNIGAPNIDDSNMTINNETCGNGNGSITGIVASGGTGGLSFDWNGTGTASEDLIGVAAGSYTITVTDGAGCAATSGPYSISNEAGPTIDPSGETIAGENCGSSDGAITGITVSGGTAPLTYEWNGTNTGSPDLTSVASGSYTLEVTDINGCTATYGPVTVPSIGGPNLDNTNVSITDESCVGNDGSITGIIASGGTAPLSFDWNGTTTASEDLIGAPSGSYTLTVTDGAGCTTSAGPFTINTIPDPTIDISNMVINDETCGNSNGSITGIQVTGGTGTLTYDWNGTTTSGPDLPNVSGGSYTLTVTDVNGCTATSGPHTIGSTPAVTAGISGVLNICEGDTTTLSASGGPGLTYSWSTGGAGAVEEVFPDTTTSIILEVTNGTCTDSDTVTVQVTPIPTISLAPSVDSICLGESINIQAAGNGVDSWSTGQTNQDTIIVSPTVDSWYFATTSNTCGSVEDSTLIVVNTLPNASAGPDQQIALGQTVILDGAGGSTYNWSPPDGLSCTNCENPDASPTQDTEYIVTVTDQNGCSSTDTVFVKVDVQNVLYIPNVFSPNGDGENDVLFVRGAGIDNFEFRIYDRWGQVIFFSDNQGDGWDGTYKNQPLNNAVFVYTISGKFLNGNEINEKGTITLVK